MKKYKVLKVEDEKLYSPWQNYYYGAMNDVLGVKMTCENFDMSGEDCSCGFYSTDVDGIIYCFNRYPNNKVFEVEVGGKSKIFDEYKQRFEKQTIVRQIPDDELKTIIKQQSDKMNWNYYKACFPVNPFEIDGPVDLERAKELLYEWVAACRLAESSVFNSVGNSVWNSVGNSVWCPVWNSVGRSVRDSVRDSVGNSVRDEVWNLVGNSVGDVVRDSVGNSVRDEVWYSVGNSMWDLIHAYISSLFPNIKKWMYIDHPEGVNPFQSGIDLWHMGLVPSFDDKIWRLHNKNGIVWEGEE